MVGPDVRGLRGLAPLSLVSGVVVLVVAGQARGLWLSNLHNGLLALAFTSVGAHVLFQRPGHREGRLFLAAGVVEALLFFGRQVGHTPSGDGSRWWGWLGVWPTVVALALTTLAVLCFPDGRLPSPGWRWVVAAVAAVTLGCAATSALWPVEYAAAGVLTAQPHTTESPRVAAYAGLQLLWVVAVAVRWRTAGPHVRRQLAWLVSAAAASVLALVVGLLAAGSPRAGVLAAALVPVAAGWAVVHGQHVVAYSALSWPSRAGGDASGLPAGFARAVAEALSAPGATLWRGDDVLHAVGVWPGTVHEVAPTTAHDLDRSALVHHRPVTRGGTRVGALSVDRPRGNSLSLAESRLFDDLASQAPLVFDHLGLADAVARRRLAGTLEGLTPRERDVLDLMARGRSNAAISAELHLSVKTVEPVVSTIFAKLGLPADAADNRRVLAVLAYLRP